MNIQKDRKLKEIIKREAFIDNPANKPVTDGPIDPDRFYTTKKPRAVFLAREPYGDNGGWDLSESLRSKISLKQQSKKGLPTFQETVKCTSMLNGVVNHCMSEAAYDNFKETAAVINVKKEPNSQSKANLKDIARHAEQNRELLKMQYENTDLRDNDTTILVGTGILVTEKKNYINILGRKFKKTDKTQVKVGKVTFTKYANGDGKGEIIATPHFSARRFIKGGIIDNIRQIKGKNLPEKSQNYSAGSIQHKNDPSNNACKARLYSGISGDCIDIKEENTLQCIANYVRNNPKKSAIMAIGITILVTGVVYGLKTYIKKGSMRTFPRILQEPTNRKAGRVTYQRP